MYGADSGVRRAALGVQDAYITGESAQIPRDIVAARAAFDDCSAQLVLFLPPRDRASQQIVRDIQAQLRYIQELVAYLGRVHLSFSTYLHAVINGSRPPPS